MPNFAVADHYAEAWSGFERWEADIMNEKRLSALILDWSKFSQNFKIVVKD